MEEVSVIRLHALRAMYLLIVLGLGVSTLPQIFSGSGNAADSHTVIGSFLTAMILLSLLGIRYPLKMLPILLFEVLWKTTWLLVFALPMHLNSGLDEYAKGVAFACVMGVILTPLVIPWRYVMQQYFLAKGSPWR